MKENDERRGVQSVTSSLLSFMIKLVALVRSVQFIWKRQRDVHPSNLLENPTNSNPPAVEAVNSAEDPVHPCMERLQKLEQAFEELKSKPAEIPVEKDQMLMDSLQRIKSVESDLEKTKRVHPPFGCLKNFYPFLSVLIFLISIHGVLAGIACHSGKAT